MNNVLFTMLRCKQEWTCSCMSTATLIIKTVTSCIATYKNKNDFILIIRNIISWRQTWRHSSVELCLPPAITQCYR